MYVYPRENYYTPEQKTAHSIFSYIEYCKLKIRERVDYYIRILGILGVDVCVVC